MGLRPLFAEQFGGKIKIPTVGLSQIKLISILKIKFLIIKNTLQTYSIETPAQSLTLSKANIWKKLFLMLRISSNTLKGI